MSIPLDRLYHYIENVAEHEYQGRVIIYRFFPHGSKKLKNLLPLREKPKDMTDLLTRIPIYCNDQEPLNYQFYQEESKTPFNDFFKILQEESLTGPFNLQTHGTAYDSSILLHSEKRSKDVLEYQNNRFVTAYYWSHAIISLDWFRFAEHVTQKKNVKKTFLIYNRAWAGTREYRLKFSEHLVRLGLEDQCQTSINPVEPELDIHYEIHQFNNPTWRPNFPLENFFPISTAHSHYSADFDIEDYEATDLEVVLETLFDDSRLHLTEKSLRPIACGQPFIIAGTHGSLEYLRSYGFKTFGNIWDERYDLIKDPEERLLQIADLIKHIANWNPSKRARKIAQAQTIAEYNKQHFFSKKFQNFVLNELKENLSTSIQTLIDTNTYQWADRWELYLKNDKVQQYFSSSENLVNVKQVSQLAAALKNK